MRGHRKWGGPGCPTFDGTQTFDGTHSCQLSDFILFFAESAAGIASSKKQPGVMPAKVSITISFALKTFVTIWLSILQILVLYPFGLTTIVVADRDLGLIEPGPRDRCLYIPSEGCGETPHLGGRVNSRASRLN